MANLQLDYLFSDDLEPDIIPKTLLLTPSIPALSNPLALSDLLALIFIIPPPPTQQFDTPELGIMAINVFARLLGYAVLTIRSKRDRYGVKSVVYLCCD